MSHYSPAIYVPESTSRPRNAATFLATVLLPTVGAVVFVVALVQVLWLWQGTRGLFRDSDTGWHIRNGETILTANRIPLTDSFSYTRPGAPWFAWEWLSDVLLGGTHRLAGTAGVAGLAAFAIAIAAWAVFRVALSFDANLFFAVGASALMLGTTSIHWLARPHVFSWILSLAFIAVAEHERRRSSRWLFALPVVACLWANLHGSFLMGPGILFLYAAGNWIDRRSGLRFAAAALASLAATFINPFGWHLHDHIFAYLANGYLMDHISEFRSFSFHSPGSIAVELFLLAAVFGLIAFVRQRMFGAALLTIGILHMAMYSARHLATAAVMLLPLSAAALTREAGNWPKWRPMLRYSERLRAIDNSIWGIAPVVVALALTAVGLNAAGYSGSVGFDPAIFPIQAAEVLTRANITDRVFTKDQWGGYLIYRFNGARKVFLDGRSDFYGQAMLEAYAEIADVKPGWNSVLRQYDIRYVMIPPDHALASVLRMSPEWKPVYRDTVAVLFERCCAKIGTANSPPETGRGGQLWMTALMTTPSAPAKEASQLFLLGASTPPLRGGEY